MNDAFKSPQVLAAIITGAVALVVAMIPILTQQSVAPTATPLPSATSVPVMTVEPSPTIIEPTATTETIEVEPTVTPLPTATLPPPTETPAPDANVSLLYDDVSFTVHNRSSRAISLSDVRFQSSSGEWNATRWGESLAGNMPANNCLRLRDAASGERQPPSVCGTLLGFQLISGNSLFWLGTDSFDVIYDGAVIATCETADESCSIFVP